MKYLLLLIPFSILNVSAQHIKLASEPVPQNFYSIRDQFYSQFDEDELQRAESENEQGNDGILEKFHRWEWLMEQRTFPTGIMPDPAIAPKEREKYQQNHPEVNSLRNSNWQPVGTAVVPSKGGGAGRVNAVRFDPNSSEIIYLATAGGGVWKSTTNGGWIPLTDFLPVTSTADVAIDPANSSIIYVATGDGYGYEATWQSDKDFWGGVYTAGIFKSMDGGTTWAPTGLNYNQDNIEIVQRLVIHPAKSNILLAATRGGIYYTNDAGTTWMLADSTHCYDFAFNTAHPDTVYSAGNKDVVWSTDGGATWSVLADNVAGTGRVSIETSDANADVIYIFNESGTFKRSDDGGLTWQNKQSPNASFYGYYDTDFDVSSADEDYLVAAGLTTTVSSNGGTSWQSASVYTPHTANNYVHADGHCARFLPGSTEVIFSGNDGGIFKSIDFGINWSDLSEGLMIAQMYRMSSSETNPDVMYSGWQDNGSNKWDGTSWQQVYGADGMETRVDYTDEDIAYIESQYGGLQKTTNGGLTFQSISPGGGPWLTPYTLDPVDHNILYYGGSSAIYKSTNGGNNWSNTNASLGNECFWVAVATSDNNYVYACALNKIKRSSDAGGTWVDITGTLPVGTVGMNYIAVSSNDPMNVWVAFSGYASGNKIFNSDDGGATWNNVSGTLPNVPVNTIVYEKNSSDGIYAGTDVGVFYRDNTLTDWVAYMTGLPNVMVHELEINYGANKLRAATYGRGIWESDLYNTIQYVNDIGITSITYPVNDVCVEEVSPVVKVKNFGTSSVNSFNVSYDIDGGIPDISGWNLNIAPFASATITLPSTIIPAAGIHTLAVSTLDPNGISDNNLINDADTSIFNTVATGTALPFEEGFEAGVMPPAGWSLENDNSIWSVTADAGGFGNSVHSAKANFKDVTSGTDMLTTPYLDFTGMVPPLHLKFDWAHASYGPQRSDTLRIRISADCGETWMDLFYKGGEDLASVPYQSSVYVPAVTDWKEETIDITDFNLFSKILLRFDAIAKHGNNLYVDDINLNGTPLSVMEPLIPAEIIAYPNPTNGAFNVFIPHTQETSSVVLCNMLGEVLSITFTKNQDNLSGDLSSQPDGMYLMKVITQTEMLMLPVILQR
ncbi:MAG: T9SS type A sorting domain-containing protein [Chitinophagales bacterium]